MFDLKKILTLVFITLFCVGCGGKSSKSWEGGVKPIELTKKIVFRYNDSLFDDRGAGRYTYPIPLEEKEGIFDLKSFVVRDLGNIIEFIIEFRRPIDQEDFNGRSYQNGWAYQLVDIYIDKDHRPVSGNTFSLPGRNIEFNEDEAWEKVVVVSPDSEKLIKNYITTNSDMRYLYEARNDIIPAHNVFSKTYSLVARVKKSDIGDPQSHWGYQVCVMGFNQENEKRNGLFNSEVRSFASETSFGGGTDYDGNPNIIDILSPDKKSQYGVMSQFRSNPYAKENLVAIIPMVYGKSKQNIPKFRQNSMVQPNNKQNNPIDRRYMEPLEGRRR
ncbi:MAG: hypothetical protein COB02_14900 [Candidatus Cloacimonadota bacterium]|nr:MAG: hypothetical protein COB02_14900 [Candidatus Cloacimonadota bacterium]